MEVDSNPALLIKNLESFEIMSARNDERIGSAFTSGTPNVD